ncbi:hypothetical protein [Achromobacter phage Motura]|uniref:Uncharacterized protein n=1 Tax=Achromobacter phage Motura TaxID=2591403 RepID=A0A514CSY3_9CAUD|nr:hypothetical protein H1O15_gp205 [Achromobacter phage Motura]QDH83583.1 hypothetical protein [Achromobacter phage Motura]
MTCPMVTVYSKDGCTLHSFKMGQSDTWTKLNAVLALHYDQPFSVRVTVPARKHATAGTWEHNPDDEFPISVERPALKSWYQETIVEVHEVMLNIGTFEERGHYLAGYLDGRIAKGRASSPMVAHMKSDVSKLRKIMAEVDDAKETLGHALNKLKDFLERK